MASSLIDSNSLIVLRCSAGISACSSASGSSLTPVGHLEAGENEMMRASVDIVGHGIGIALLLRVQAGLDKSPTTGSTGRSS